MGSLLKKEMRLSASVLSYIFIVFGVMTLVPGYPILCGVFFLTLGIFHSFQNAREANDMLFSTLLPIAKKDVVRGKYMFAIIVELAGFLIMALLTIIRMTALADAEIYRENALMNANPFFLGAALVILGLFNLVFIGGFFKTAYKLSSFVVYIVVAFVAIGISEALHHIPGLEALNSFGLENIGLQLVLLIGGVIIYAALTFLSYNKSCGNFEKIDL